MSYALVAPNIYSGNQPTSLNSAMIRSKTHTDTQPANAALLNHTLPHNLSEYNMHVRFFFFAELVIGISSAILPFSQ